MGKNFYKNLGL